MNTLSWLILLGGTASAIKGFLIACTIFSGAAAIFFFARGLYYQSDEEWTNIKPCQEDMDRSKASWSKLRWIIPLFVIIGLSSAFTPDRNTVYLIAASEITEMSVDAVLEDQDTQKIIKLTKQKIINYLEER